MCEPPEAAPLSGRFANPRCAPAWHLPPPRRCCQGLSRNMGGAAELKFASLPSSRARPEIPLFHPRRRTRASPRIKPGETVHCGELCGRLTWRRGQIRTTVCAPVSAVETGTGVSPSRTFIRTGERADTGTDSGTDSGRVCPNGRSEGGTTNGRHLLPYCLPATLPRAYQG